LDIQVASLSGAARAERRALPTLVASDCHADWQVVDNQLYCSVDTISNTVRLWLVLGGGCRFVFVL
jgi:hypothetical protein